MTSPQGPYNYRLGLILALVSGLAGAVWLLPLPAGLSTAGQRVLMVAVVAIGLWSTEALPMAVTGMLVVVLLALYGFQAYFS